MSLLFSVVIKGKALMPTTKSIQKPLETAAAGLSVSWITLVTTSSVKTLKAIHTINKHMKFTHMVVKHPMQLQLTHSNWPFLKHAGTPGQYNRRRRRDSRDAVLIAMSVLLCLCFLTFFFPILLFFLLFFFVSHVQTTYYCYCLTSCCLLKFRYIRYTDLIYTS